MKKFLTKSTLRTHMAYVHETVKKFKCEFCQKSFALQGILTSHVKKTHGTIKCKICFKEVKGDSINIRRHMLTHPEADHLKCHICQILFTQKWLLDDHLLIHSNPKAFQCKNCEKCFENRSSLRQHSSKSKCQK